MSIGIGQRQTLSQQQTLSPQMQQSLHILQAPLMELSQMISQELAVNPVLEEDFDRSGGDGDEWEEKASETSDAEDLWDTYHSQQADVGAVANAQERQQFLMESIRSKQPLSEELERQLSFADFSEVEKGITKQILGNLDESGYLSVPIEEIAAVSGVTPLRVEEILEEVQGLLEPAGLAARDLRECLLLQLARRGKSRGVAARILDKYLEQLGRHHYAEIAKSLNESLGAVEAAAEEIGRLNPHPGRILRKETAEIIEPDVFIEYGEEGLEVRLNAEGLPALKISDIYKDMLAESSGQKELQSYLRDHIRSGRFFLKTVEQRNETILRIARELALRQEDFFYNGVGHLKPMKMSEVAAAVGVHETTVSRAVNGKYLQSPVGIFEMKYFFTAGYETEEGKSISNESVRQAVADIIQNEPEKKPLSDDAIAKVLREQGINVARRTIAKYREQLGILPSHLRRRR
ncbi:MAG: RNA polymerase factor sigma-54 [Chthoniobacterales bacterium]